LGLVVRSGDLKMANIVIIDDSVSVRAQVRQVLESAGHTVIECDNGDHGFEKLVELKTPDLVITDYNMPGLDGISMLERVKETVRESYKYPIFMLTTETSERLKTAGKQAGVMAWINKPFSTDKMLAAVNKVLAMKKAG
jgi:two-component system chemotaxis response regulator CheY